MSSDEVSQLLARTRANRERVNRHLKDIGESPHPIRSPLKERNAAGISPRPSPSKIKTTYSSRSPVAAKESRFRSRSPSGIRETFSVAFNIIGLILCCTLCTCTWFYSIHNAGKNSLAVLQNRDE